MIDGSMKDLVDHGLTVPPNEVVRRLGSEQLMKERIHPFVGVENHRSIENILFAGYQIFGGIQQERPVMIGWSHCCIVLRWDDLLQQGALAWP